MRCAAAIQVHEETVELAIEGSGAPLSMKALLVNGKVHLPSIEKVLAAQRLNLNSINGIIPVPDSDGFSRETYSPGDTLTIKAALEPGVCGVRGVCCKRGLTGHDGSIAQQLGAEEI